MTADGDPADVLAVVTLPDPEPGPGEVVIQVAAAGLNFADILMCQGRYQERPPVPFTLGLELAGTVLTVGDGVRGLAPGDRVAALTTATFGALAEQVTVAAERVVPIPPTMSFAAAAALLINYGTGWFALRDRAAIVEGEWLLVHTGAGGVGSAAIQLGRAAGARVDRDGGRRRQGRVVPRARRRARGRLPRRRLRRAREGAHRRPRCRRRVRPGRW